MDIEDFLKLKPMWAMEPCVYIVKQMATENPNAHRCGASGTHMFAGADRPYGSENATRTGLLARLQMYSGFWLPVKGKIFAALRVKRALVAEIDRHRTGEDSAGNVYNIDRGGHTLVLAREREFHNELDRRGYRWQTDKRNELFVPRRNVQELIAALRTVKGETMYLMFADGSVLEDESYRGGSRRETVTVQPTAPRQVQDREVRVPSLTIRLSKDSVDQLRSSNPQTFARLLNIMQTYDEDAKRVETMRMSATDIERCRRYFKSEPSPPKPASAPAQPAQPPQPRRSARLAR